LGAVVAAEVYFLRITHENFTYNLCPLFKLFKYGVHFARQNLGSNRKNLALFSASSSATALEKCARSIKERTCVNQLATFIISVSSVYVGFVFGQTIIPNTRDVLYYL
jgi:hypothetical protein